MIDVSAYVFTVGEPSTQAAVDAVTSQVSHVEVVTDVAPPFAAFNRMAAAPTEWVVQVDADMILYPSAVEELAREAEAADASCAMVTGLLYGDAEQHPVGHVKLHRRDSLRDVPFTDAPFADRVRYLELGSCGMTVAACRKVIGEHISLQTVKTAFGRWYKLMIGRRRGASTHWAVGSLVGLVSRAIESQDKILIAAAIGGLVGCVAPLPDNEHSARHVPPVLSATEVLCG